MSTTENKKRVEERTKDREWATRWEKTCESCTECSEGSFCKYHDPQIIRAKWAMDGARTLSEAAAKLRAFAQALEEWEQDGWQLMGRVDDDYGHVIPATRVGKDRMVSPGAGGYEC